MGGGSNQGGAASPILICLPGRSRPPEALLEGGLRFGDFRADGIEKRGVTPFAVAALQASDMSWHARATGDDAMAMLFDEFVPFLRDQRDLTGQMANHVLVHGRVRGAAGGGAARAGLRRGLRSERRPVRC